MRLKLAAPRIKRILHLKDKAGVYALYQNEVVVYVGISKNLFERLYHHMTYYGNDVMFDILEYLDISGSVYSRQHIERERYWISYYRSLGQAIKNKTGTSKSKIFNTMKLILTALTLFLFSCTKQECSKVVESVPCLVCAAQPSYRNTMSDGSTIITSQPKKVGEVICTD